MKLTCNQCSQIVERHSVRFVASPSGELKVKEKCPSCDGELSAPPIESGPYEVTIGEFSSSDLQHKRDDLKKRSSKHFNKHIKEYRDHKLRTLDD